MKVQKQQHVKRRSWTTGLGLLLTVVLLAVFSSTVLAAGPYDGQDGPLAVSTIDTLNLTDAKRDRTIPVKIYYPDGPGPFPIVLYSHGLGGSKDGKRYLGKYWASHGYIGIFMTHFGSDRSVTDSKLPFNSPENKARLRAATKPQSTFNRPWDVTAVIDGLDFIEQQVDALKGRMDHQRIAVTGHSYGSMTVMLSAGGYAQQARALGHQFRDDRPRAFIAMSPRPAGPRGNPDAIWSEIDRPMMTMTGGNDTDPIGAGINGETRKQPFEKMPPGDKYLLWLDGAYHWTFGDATKNRQPEAAHHLAIKAASLAFLDAYLKDSPDAKKFLTSGAIGQLTGNSATITCK